MELLKCKKAEVQNYCHCNCYRYKYYENKKERKCGITVL